MTITQVTVSGTGFSASGLSLPLTLTGGQSATFTAAFVSNATGGALGGITVASDATGSPMTISMNANVVAAVLQLTPFPATVNFGNGTIGTAETLNVQLTNTGNSSVSISTVTASGPGFSASGGSNATLAPNQMVNVTVTFNATSGGPAAGNLTVTSDGPPLQVGLYGTGVNTAVQRSVALSWSPSSSAVVGYFVYRGDGLNGGLAKLIPSITLTTNFTDSSVMGGQSYNYAVTSVDSSNVESTFSNPTSVTIPAN